MDAIAWGPNDRALDLSSARNEYVLRLNKLASARRLKGVYVSAIRRVWLNLVRGGLQDDKGVVRRFCVGQAVFRVADFKCEMVFSER